MTVGAAAIALVAPCAVAAAGTDNIVPTGNYLKECKNGRYLSAVVCQTDNRNVTYYMDSHGDFKLESEDRAVVRRVLKTQYSPTDLAVSYDSTPKFTGPGETDIVYQEGSSSARFDGYAWCDDSSAPGTYACDQSIVRIEGYGKYLNDGLVCHETGHSVGLTHGSEAYVRYADNNPALGCMQTPVWTGTKLGSNQITNINKVY